MEKQTKIAVVSCYFQYNYGSQLQAWATQKILDCLDYDNETVDISGFRKQLDQAKVKYYLENIKDWGLFWNRIKYVYSKLYKKINRAYGKNDKIRNQKHREFISRFRLTSQVSSLQQLSKLIETSYHAVLVGSDQLWLPSNIDADYYTLNWVPDQIKKISYATSFGVDHLDQVHRAKTKTFLGRFQSVSVRERSAVGLVKSCGIENVQLVCDPTLLLSRDDWEEIQPDKPVVDGNYIFCYFIGNNAEHRSFAKKLSQKTGLKIVALPHVGRYKSVDCDYCGLPLYDVGPGEFVNLIRNASYVCTDSFHGTVFSIIHHTEFFTFMRFKGGKGSTNTRIDSLFDTIGYSGRLVRDNTKFDDYLTEKIPFDDIDEKISALRKASIGYLMSALE